jgi:hypothetical protein
MFMDAFSQGKHWRHSSWDYAFNDRTAALRAAAMAEFAGGAEPYARILSPRSL